MHIGVFSYDFDPPIGGLGIHVKRLQEGLLAAHTEHSFTVFSPSPLAPIKVSRIARRRWNKSGGSPAFSLTLWFGLERIIREHALDLVHMHGGSGGIVLRKKPSVPFVMTVHHTYLAETTHVFSGSFLKKHFKNFMARLEKRTYQMADLLICVSEDTKQDLMTHYGIAAAKIIVIENSLDEQQFLNEPLIPDKTHELLFIGRLEPRKGIDVLLSAFEILKKEMPELHLTVIGENLMNDAFITDAEEKFGSTVSFLGHTSEASLKEHMQSATLLIVPSRVEGFGLTAAEGMAAGMCVVASNAPGLRSVITHEDTGLLFENENVLSCADTIKRALRDPELRRNMGQNASHAARQRFKLRTQVQNTLQAYLQARK